MSLPTKYNAEYNGLFDAAISGDLSRIETALTTSTINININALENKTGHCLGRACLHIVAASGNVPAIRLLLAKGANVNVRDIHGDTALHHAAYGVHKTAVEVLLDAGAPVNSVSGRYNYTVAYHLLRYKQKIDREHVQIIRLLLDRGFDINAQLGLNYSNTLISEAAAMHSLELVQLLVRRGAVVPHHILTKVYKYDIAALLLKHGAKLVADSQYKHQVSPIVIAASAGKLKLLKLYLTHADDADILASANAIHRAAENGYLEVVDLLINRGWDVNTVADELREAPLSAACGASQSNIRMVQKLLDKGADITIRDSEGCTACNMTTLTSPGTTRRLISWIVHRAVGRSHYQIIRLLLSQGSNASVPDLNGRTPLMYAAYAFRKSTLGSRYDEHDLMDDLHFKCFQLILDNTVDINVQDIDGYTALHALGSGFLSGSAGSHARLEAARLLIERGADLNVQTCSSTTAGELFSTNSAQGILVEKASGTDPHRYCYMMLLQPPA
ncbi:MAG: hypothetical protein Q9196_005937, partial [Gyalolechia fulgens]